MAILLARLHVAGTAYYDAEAAADRLRPGQRLALRRQPENRYDALARRPHSIECDLVRLDASAAACSLGAGRHERS